MVLIHCTPSSHIVSTYEVSSEYLKYLRSYALDKKCGRTDGRPSGWSLIGYFFCLKLPNKRKTTQQENKRNECNLPTNGHLLGISIPNMCPLMRPDGHTHTQTDGDHYHIPQTRWVGG